MISRSDEQKILDQYKALLEGARGRLRKQEDRMEKARSEVSNLEAIVNGVSNRIAGHAGGDVLTISGSNERIIGGAGVSVRYGRPTLTSLVRQIMADGVARNVDMILAELERRGEETAAQGTRQQVGNRLVELKNQGYLKPLERGVYVLASAEAERNGAANGMPASTQLPGPNDSGSPTAVPQTSPQSLSQGGGGRPRESEGE